MAFSAQGGEWNAALGRTERTSQRVESAVGFPSDQIDIMRRVLTKAERAWLRMESRRNLRWLSTMTIVQARNWIEMLRKISAFERTRGGPLVMRVDTAMKYREAKRYIADMEAVKNGQVG